MFGSTLKSVALSVALLLPGLASAATVSLTYNGGTSNGSVKIVSAPANVFVMPLGSTVGAYGFKMTDTTNQMGSFVAWCLDISHYLGTTGAQSYKTTTTPFDSSYGLDTAQMARVQAVFDANFASVVQTNAKQAAGFQVALWNALYDTDWSASGGTFKVSDGTSGATAQGTTYLTAASTYSGPHKYNMTFLESQDCKQNLVTVAPVPIPAAGFLLVGALGGLGALRRRRKA